MCGLNSRNVLSHHSGGWKSRIKREVMLRQARLLLRTVREGLSPPPLTFWWYSRAPCLSLVYRSVTCLCLHPHIVFSLCASVSKFPSDKATPVILTSILINYTCNDPPLPKKVTFTGLGIQHMNFEGCTQV